MTDERTCELLAELPWLSGLARALVADPQLAADLVQGTCVQALTAAAPPRQPRAWLATVLRNLLRQEHRRQRVRHRVEAVAARAEPVEDAIAVVARAELHQRLSGHVLALPEPYRATVLLRFFEGLPPRAIARRLGVPVATVHSRLQRALQSLRDGLDREHGGRARWLAALMPVPVLPAGWSWIPGVVLMQTKTKILLAAIAVASVLPFLWPSGSGAEAAPPVGAAPVPVAAADGEGGGRSGAAAAGARPQRERVEPAASAPAGASTTPALVTASGIVCDGSGSRIGGIRIVRQGSDEVLAQSDASGRFQAQVEPAACTFVAGDPGYETVLAATWDPASRLEAVLVVAAMATVRGRVVDRNGGAVALANVLFSLPADFNARFPVPLDRGDWQRWQARSQADGTFALPRVPQLAGASLLVAADTFLPRTVDVPPQPEVQLEIALDKFAYESGQLTGVVVDAGGTPVGGARVAMGLTSVVSEGDGRFALPLRRAGWPTALVAAKAGHLPGRIELPRAGGAKVEDWPSPLVIRLGGPPLSIRGRVVDQDGKGIADAIVWVRDPTLLGIAGMLPVQLEYLLAGGELPPGAARMQPRFADDPTTEGRFNDQAGVVRRPTACWWFATADGEGAFELAGLLPRDYTLQGLDVGSGIVGQVTATAGTTTELRITRARVLPRLRGQVRTGRGLPVPGVQVRQYVRAFTANVRVPGGRFEGQALREGQQTTTDADGWFELRDVGSEQTFLELSGDAILPTAAEVRDLDPVAATITVQARCHVEVVLADPTEATSVCARDRNGEIVDCAVLRQNSTSMTTELDLHQGRSGVFVLSEAATVLQLRRGEMVVREVPLQLAPGRTTTIQ